MIEHRGRLLCIDDDRQTAGLIAEELTDRGYAVSLAFDGQQGLQAAETKPFDLILADVSMPIMSGFDLLEALRLRALPRTMVPFLYLTALADRAHELRGRQLGADDYVTKPIDFEILAQIIATRLSRSPRPPALHGQIGLTEREAETLTWAARGKTSAEIGQILRLAKRTVDFHIDNARLKLGATSRVHAAARAAACQLIEP